MYIHSMRGKMYLNINTLSNFLSIPLVKPNNSYLFSLHQHLYSQPPTSTLLPKQPQLTFDIFISGFTVLPLYSVSSPKLPLRCFTPSQTQHPDIHEGTRNPNLVESCFFKKGEINGKNKRNLELYPCGLFACHAF